MRKSILLIVITRLKAKYHGVDDEFIHDWNVTDGNKAGELFSLTRYGDKLLLIHGHADLLAKTESGSSTLPNFKNIIERAISEIGTGSINFDDFNIWLFVHGSMHVQITEQRTYRSFEKSDIGDLDCIKQDLLQLVTSYTSDGRSVTTGFVRELRDKAKEIVTEECLEEIVNAVENKFLNPSILQIKYLKEISGLLLQLKLDVATAIARREGNVLQQDMIDYLRATYKQICDRLRHPKVLTLRPRGLDNAARIFVIADDPKTDGLLGEFDHFDPEWKCTPFWRWLISSKGQPFDVQGFEMKHFEVDLQLIAKGVDDLIRQVDSRL